MWQTDPFYFQMVPSYNIDIATYNSENFIKINHSVNREGI